MTASIYIENKQTDGGYCTILRLNGIQTTSINDDNNRKTPQTDLKTYDIPTTRVNEPKPIKNERMRCNLLQFCVDSNDNECFSDDQPPSRWLQQRPGPATENGDGDGGSELQQRWGWGWKRWGLRRLRGSTAAERNQRWRIEGLAYVSMWFGVCGVF